MNPTPALIALLLLPLLGACRSEPSSAPEAALTAEQRDRKDLLRQPMQGWTPGDAPRKLNIQFLTERNKIRKGEPFKYRLEMQNVGREALSFKESAPSFIKEGSLCGESSFKLYVTPPGGKERALACKPAAAGAVAASTAPAKAPETGLDLAVQPGEYLLTRRSGPGGPFRELQAKFQFAALGTYRLRAVYAAKDGFKAASNAVTVEVVP